MSIDDMQRVLDVLRMNPKAVDEAFDPDYRPLLLFQVRDVGQVGRLAALYEREVDHRDYFGVHRRSVALPLDGIDVEFYHDAPLSPVLDSLAAS